MSSVATSQLEAPDTAESSALLSARDLWKTYHIGRVDVEVLKGATLEVERGEWIAVLGASGCGKSTLLHLMGDLDRPDSGRGDVRFEGRTINTMSRSDRIRFRNRSVGFVFQFYHLLPELTVTDNVLLPAFVRASHEPRWWRVLVLVLGIVGGVAGAVLCTVLLFFALRQSLGFPPEKWYDWPLMMLVWVLGAGIGGVCGGVVFAGLFGGLWTEVKSWLLRFSPSFQAKRAEAVALLTTFGLGHRLTHRPRELSGGEHQRVAIARALINDPVVLLADEPTGNLDEDTGREILDILAEQHRNGLTIVMVTHDQSIAARADRIVELQHGTVV